MKTHVRNTAVGGILLPIALLLATAIANEGQALLGLELDRVSLALFLLPFLYGCTELIKALMKLEISRIGSDLMHDFGTLGDLFGGGGEPKTPPTRPPAPPIAGAEPPPPPPVPPAGSGLFREPGK